MMLEDPIEEIIEKGLIYKQVAKYICDGDALKALNMIWPLALTKGCDKDYQLLLGISYFHYGKKADAKIYLNAAIKLDPGNFLARYYFARIFLEEENYGAALLHLEEIVRHGHEDYRVNQGISALRTKLGKK